MTMAVKFYKQANDDFIERYAIINDKVLAFETFFPARYDQITKVKMKYNRIDKRWIDATCQ